MPAALRLEALGEQQQWMSSLETEVGELEAELLELESKRQENLTRFGLAEIAGAKTPPSDPRGWSSCGPVPPACAAAADLSKLKQTIAAADETAATHERQLAGMLDKRHTGGLTRALADAGEHVSQLRKRVQLDERLDQMSRREAELEEQSQEHLESQMLPTWVIFGVGAMFVMGCALVLLYLAGLVLPISFHAHWAGRSGLIGVLAAVAGSFTKVIMERRPRGVSRAVRGNCRYWDSRFSRPRKNATLSTTACRAAEARWCRGCKPPKRRWHASSNYCRRRPSAKRPITRRPPSRPGRSQGDRVSRLEKTLAATAGRKWAAGRS